VRTGGVAAASPPSPSHPLLHPSLTPPAGLSKQLADVVKNAQRDAARGKQLLDDLKKEGEDLMRSNPKSDRLQPYKAQYMRLCKLYVDAMKDHQKSKETMRKVQTEDLVRRGMIIYGEGKTEGEIRDKVEKDPANFVRDALMEEAADEAQQAYVEAQSRARDVEMLVRSLNEVAAMFQDLAVLVQHQSEMLDSIEENVESATTYIKKGNQAMRDAIEAQKKARKCWCCFIIVIIVVILATVSGVGAAFGVKDN
jgi:t-SNARE complex subunit (syntaxin)